MKVVTHKRLHSTCFIFNEKSRTGKSMAIKYKFMVPYGWGHRDPSRWPVQLLSNVQLFATPRITAHQASLSITNSRSSLKIMSIELVIPSSHLILSPPSPPAPNPSQDQGLFQWVNSSHEVAEVLEFQLQHQSSNEHTGLISFRMDWLDLLAVQGILKSLLQQHNSKAPILQLSTFFTVQLSHPYMTTGKTIALTRWAFIGKVISLLLNMPSRLVISFLPRKRNQRSNCQHPMDHRKSKRVPEKHLFLLYWLCQSLWLCGSQ